MEESRFAGFLLLDHVLQVLRVLLVLVVLLVVLVLRGLAPLVLRQRRRQLLEGQVRRPLDRGHVRRHQELRQRRRLALLVHRLVLRRLVGVARGPVEGPEHLSAADVTLRVLLHLLVDQLEAELVVLVPRLRDGQEPDAAPLLVRELLAAVARAERLAELAADERGVVALVVGGARPRQPDLAGVGVDGQRDEGARLAEFLHLFGRNEFRPRHLAEIDAALLRRGHERLDRRPEHRRLLLLGQHVEDLTADDQRTGLTQHAEHRSERRPQRRLHQRLVVVGVQRPLRPPGADALDDAGGIQRALDAPRTRLLRSHDSHHLSFFVD